MSSPTWVAKLTRPRLRDIEPRARLFQRLEQLQHDGPTLWVGAPAGSGKTSLLVSYIEARNLPVLWYRIDERDQHVEELFFYLRLAAEALEGGPRGSMELPVFSNNVDLARFSRRFFEALFLRLPRGALLVFDDYHTLSVGPQWQAAFERGLSSIPEGLNVVVISRQSAPSSTDTGGRAGFPVARVLAKLWPDSDGDNATHNFDMTMLRLRNQLGEHGRRALRVERGRVLLDPSLCWTDTAALSSLFGEIATLDPEGARCPLQLARCIALADRLEDLYRGPFAEDEDASPLADYNQRTRAKVAGALRALSTRLTELGDASRAETLRVRLFDCDSRLKVPLLQEPRAEP